MNQVKPKLSSSNKNVSEDMLSTDAATRKRLEYEKVAEKLKTAFKQKDKVRNIWLFEMEMDFCHVRGSVMKLFFDF